VITLGRLLAAALVVSLGAGLLDRGELLRTAQFQLARLDTARPAWNAAVFVATYLTAGLAIAVCLCHRRAIRVSVLAATLLAACIQASVAAVNGVGFTHHEAWLLFTESQFLGGALRFFFPRYAAPAAATLLAGALFAWLAMRVGPRLRSWLWLAVPVVAGVAAQQMLHQTFGRVYQLPPPFRIAVLTSWAWSHRLPMYVEREPPRFGPTRPPLADHVVFVVDESISGHWLGVNGAPVETTPWLSSRPAGLFNYGIASAVSNLSASSNLVLQTGLRPDALPDRELRSLREPNLFAYLGAAGYHTALIDAQSYSDAPPNLMTGFDLRRIDTVIRMREVEPGLPEHAVDFAAIARIRALVEAHPRSFVYVIKTGAHLPYDDKSPPEQRPFSLPGLRGPEATLHAYWNAIRWTTDRFLRDLSRALEASGRDALVLYTSDHGQWLAGDAGAADRRISPHATVTDPPDEQASVPLLLLAFGARTRPLVAERFASALVDRASAFEIFPTLLQAAGYAAEDTAPLHPPSLFEPDAARAPRRFVSGNLFGSNAGAYVLNPGVGEDCFLNDFDVESVRPSEP
jgi:lipid A ethanolaminephosphotransferase